MILSKLRAIPYPTLLSLCAIVWLFTALQPLAWAATIPEAAQVLVAIGEVHAEKKGTPLRALKRGSLLYQGDIVVTKEGQTQVRFTDGTLLSIYKHTRFAIDDYHFSGQEEDRASFNLIGGLVHTLTGKISKNINNNFIMQTTLALLGVRGTDFTVLSDKSLHVSVHDGAVFLENSAGSLLVEAGQMAMVVDENVLPNLTSQPMDVQQLQLIPTLPKTSTAQKTDEQQDLKSSTVPEHSMDQDYADGSDSKEDSKSEQNGFDPQALIHSLPESASDLSDIIDDFISDWEGGDGPMDDWDREDGPTDMDDWGGDDDDWDRDNEFPHDWDNNQFQDCIDDYTKAGGDTDIPDNLEDLEDQAGKYCGIDSTHDIP